MKNNNRFSGVLMHISSLPESFGIGTFGKCAYRFIDWLESSGFSLWQILPLNPTGFGNSPYMSASSFAGNPYFIDLKELENKGYLKLSDFEDISWGTIPSRVDYGRIFKGRQKVFSSLFENFLKNTPQGYYEFCRRNAYWIEDFSLFSAIKNTLGGAPLKNFPEKLKLRDPDTLENFKKEHEKEIEKEKMLQFFFFDQWISLKAYANKKGIKIIGDMPIYVSSDSCEVWAHPENFLLTAELNPRRLAGCPPDSFSPLGQLWGNPVYDWEYLKSQNYRFLTERIAHGLKTYDILRIDHFRGFESFYSVDETEKTAINGVWQKSGGKDFIKTLNAKVDGERIIAEDLGFLTKEVEELLYFSGYPGMKVLQFILDEKEKSAYLPHFYSENSIVFTGTHDNDTLLGRISSASPDEINFICEYLKTEKKDLREALIIEALKSVCRYAVIPLQDILGLDSAGRMNTPGSAVGNWEWRLERLNALEKHSDFFLKNNRIYGRIGNFNERF